MVLPKKRMERWKRGKVGQRQTELLEFKMVEQKPKKTYKQQWSAYNLAQTQEYPLFHDLLIELIDTLIQVRPPLYRRRGKPSFTLKDKLFCIVMKIYFGKSSRREVGFLSDAKNKGYIDKVPSFNSILRWFNEPFLTPILKHLIEQSGIPLRDVESQFAIDSSGFSTSIYGRWLDVRIGKPSLRRLFKKAHVTSGTRTGIATACSVTEGYKHDSPEFFKLVEITSKNFKMREISGDAAYCSRENYNLVSSLGAIPFLDFKSNIVAKARGSYIFKRMFEIYKNHKEEWKLHYHRRSLAESLFSRVKRKFGVHLYSRTEIGQENEILCKILSHNICVLIQELFEANTTLDFDGCAKAIVRGNMVQFPN